MKKITPEYTFTDAQCSDIRALARECGLREITAKILYSRGVDTPEKVREFLSPSAEHFLSPFLMRGMRELVDAIGEVRREGGTVAVFGDYDADGIGAASVLTAALRRYGVDCVAYIPERAEGYGLSVAALEKIIDEYTPSLIVTVDCGVSCREEVEYVKARGVRIIVTDHHELPEVLPDCTVINPKIADDYPYDNLCGAGVAFKIACALLGEDAYPLVQLAAVSTVADSVPLVGENRDIVAEGLRRINGHPCDAIAGLLAGRREDITATSLAFTVAPRINAAGRMGDANSALRLFTSENKAEIYDLTCLLNEYNIGRQQACDEAYRCAKEKIEREGAYGNIIMLCDENWNTGLVGIVAAKIAEEFNRPAILFVQRGDMLKGSARTIENINIYEALKACSQYISEFGGHAQAAGVNITRDNFEPLKQALDEYIGARYKPEDLVPVLSVCEHDLAIDLSLARELARLEPYGVGNRRPLFSVRAGAVQVRRLKQGSPHISFRAGEMDLIWFGGEKALPLLQSDLSKEIVFECDVSVFRGKASVRGIVRDMVVCGEGGPRTALYAFRNNLLRLTEKPVSVSVVRESEAELISRIRMARAACNYGLLVLCSESVPDEFRECLSGLDAEYFRPGAGNAGNTLVIAPAADAAFAQYRDIVWLDRPADFNMASLAGKKLYVSRDRCGYEGIAALEISHKVFAELYRALRGAAGEDTVSAALAAKTPFTPEQTLFALEVFCELGLLRISGGLVCVTGKRSELNRSALYRAVCALKEKQ